jgi:molecular chaperone IbpA
MAMTMIDLTPFSRSSIGFDRMFNMLENATQLAPAENYPPYNIERTGEDTYRITIAVAGFTPDDLTLTAQANQLVVSGNRPQSDETEYLYQGIAGRAFRREFSLADHVKVAGASLNNGMLVIDLVREVPEAMRPRKIQIGNRNQPQQIEGRAAAA